MTTKHTAPQTLTMHLCIQCGRFENYAPLGHRTGSSGPVCRGEIVKVRYVRSDIDELRLEIRGQSDETANLAGVMVTPPIDEDYWSYRVQVGVGQAIVGFPKFLTIGIGFAQESDWNTNLPYTCSAEEIYNHIKHNKGDNSISRETCLTAIRMIQDAVRKEVTK